MLPCTPCRTDDRIRTSRAVSVRTVREKITSSARSRVEMPQSAWYRIASTREHLSNDMGAVTDACKAAGVAVGTGWSSIERKVSHSSGRVAFGYAWCAYVTLIKVFVCFVEPPSDSGCFLGGVRYKTHITCRDTQTISQPSFSSLRSESEEWMCFHVSVPALWQALKHSARPGSRSVVASAPSRSVDVT